MYVCMYVYMYVHLYTVYRYTYIMYHMSPGTRSIIYFNQHHTFFPPPRSCIPFFPNVPCVALTNDKY